VASALAGVAIAVALLPPLATVGLGLVGASREVALGAGLLFLTNLVAIVSAAGLFFFLMGFHPESDQESRERTFRGGLWGTLTLLVAVTAVLATLTVNALQQSRFERAVTTALEQELVYLGEEVTMQDWRTVTRHADGISIEVELQSTADLDPAEAKRMEEALEANLGEPVDLAVIITRVQRMEASWAAD